MKEHKAKCSLNDALSDKINLSDVKCGSVSVPVTVIDEYRKTHETVVAAGVEGIAA